MKFKMLLSTAVAAAAFATAFSANATPLFPTYQVVAPGATVSPFTANDLGGQYTEKITFTDATHFAVSLIFNGGQFSLDDTTTPVTYNANQTGLGSHYGLYATFMGTGTFGPGTTAGSTAFSLTAGNLSVYLDQLLNTTFTPPATGTAPWILGNTADDVLLGTGTNAFGSGVSTCTGGNNCGSFGQTVSFSLTSAGSAFFVSPVPFFNVALTSGQFEGVNPVVGTTVLSTGTANTVFNVPEPSPLALVGLGLLALGISRRRSTKA